VIRLQCIEDKSEEIFTNHYYKSGPDIVLDFATYNGKLISNN